MADTKTSDLALKATPAAADLLVLVDVTATGTVNPSFPGRGPEGTTSKSPVSGLASSISTILGLGTAATHAATDFQAAGSYSPLAGSTSITTLGTIVTGTWDASPIGVAYLGTGTPSAGKYLDGGGSWTTIGSSSIKVTAANGALGVSPPGSQNCCLIAGTTGSEFVFSKTGFFGIAGGSSYGDSSGTNLAYLVFGSTLNTIIGTSIYSDPDPGVQLLVQSSSGSKGSLAVRGAASQTAPLQVYQQLSSTSTARNVGIIDATFNSATDASWTGDLRGYAGDYTSSNAGKREGWRVRSDGTQALIGFYGATPTARPVLSYSRTTAGETVAIAAIRVALASLGLVVDSTTS